MNLTETGRQVRQIELLEAILCELKKLNEKDDADDFTFVDANGNYSKISFKEIERYDLSNYHIFVVLNGYGRNTTIKGKYMNKFVEWFEEKKKRGKK